MHAGRHAALPYYGRAFAIGYVSLLGGAFVCLPQFDVERALQLIASERITNLYLVPTLYHDLVHHPRALPKPT